MFNNWEINGTIRFLAIACTVLLESSSLMRQAFSKMNSGTCLPFSFLSFYYSEKEE